MKTDHCKYCKKYKANACIDIKECKLMTAEMKRIEFGRAKKAIHITYQSNMGRFELMQFDNLVYGAYDGD